MGLATIHTGNQWKKKPLPAPHKPGGVDIGIVSNALTSVTQGQFTRHQPDISWKPPGYYHIALLRGD